MEWRGAAWNGEMRCVEWRSEVCGMEREVRCMEWRGKVQV